MSYGELMSAAREEQRREVEASAQQAEGPPIHERHGEATNGQRGTQAHDARRRRTRASRLEGTSQKAAATRSVKRWPSSGDGRGRARKSLIRTVVGVALVGSLSAWLVQRVVSARAAQAEVATTLARSVQEAARAEEPVVRVVTATLGRRRARVELSGTLTAHQSVDLAFRVSGKLQEVGVEVGDTVEEGRQVAALDAREARARLAVAEAHVLASGAQVVLASDEEKRTLALVLGGASPTQSRVQAVQQSRLVSAQHRAAQAERDVAEAVLQNHTLVAPFAGVVTSAPAGIGGVVLAGQPLFRLVDTSILKLRTSVTESEATMLKVGATVVVEGDEGEARGHIASMVAELDPATRRVPLEARFEAPRGLLAGAFVRAWAESEEIPVLQYPRSVLMPGTSDRVMVLTAESTTEPRRIEWIGNDPEALFVRKGLESGDRVVLSPSANLESGRRVRIADDAPEGTHR